MDENKASTPASSPFSSSPGSSCVESVGSVGLRQLKRPRRGGSVDIAGVVADLQVASQTQARVRLYGRLSDVEDSFATPDRTSPAWLDCKDNLLQSCLRDCGDDRDQSAVGLRLRDYAFNWLAILWVRCDNWSEAQISHIELALFRFLGLAQGFVSEIQQANGWAVLYARFVRETTDCNSYLRCGDQNGEELAATSRSVQQAFRIGLAKNLQNQSLYAAVPSVFSWIAGRHPRLLFHGSVACIPPLVNFNSSEMTPEAAKSAIEFEIVLWDAIEAAVSKMILETAPSDPAWSEVGKFLGLLTHRTLELNVVALASVDLKDSIAELGATMAAVLSTLLPTPTRVDNSSKENLAIGTIAVAPSLQFIAAPCLRLVLLLLEAAAITAALSNCDSSVRAPGNLQPSSSSSTTLNDVDFADALIHTPEATGAWAALVDFAISGNDSGALLELLVHFSLYGVVSQDKCRPPQCSLVMFRRGLVPILAGAFFGASPAARAASATNINVWHIARTHLSISPNLLLMAIESRQNCKKTKKKEKEVPSPGNGMSLNASSDHGSSCAAQHTSTESTSNLGRVSAGALLVSGCFVPVGGSQGRENRNVEDSIGYFDPVVIVKGSVFNRAAMPGGKRGNLFSLASVLDCVTTHGRTKKKRRQSSLDPGLSSPPKKTRPPKAAPLPHEGSALDGSEAKQAASFRLKNAMVSDECNTRGGRLESETGASVSILDIRRGLEENTATIDRALKAIEHHKEFTEHFVQEARRKMDELLAVVEGAREENRRLESLVHMYSSENNA